MKRGADVRYAPGMNQRVAFELPLRYSASSALSGYFSIFSISVVKFGILLRFHFMVSNAIAPT
jgi:hypothetical protein